MPPSHDNIEANAADAIMAVSHEGLRRSGWLSNIALFLRIPPWMVSAAAVFLLVVALLAGYWWLKPPTLVEIPVAILLPSEEAKTVKENVDRQRKGFELAWKENAVINADQQRIFKYSFPLNSEEKIDEVMTQIQDWYEEGVRVFIITMSGSALAVGKRFRSWVLEIPDRDRPILIATVASAPGIADSDVGIFRHYIRSEDESSVLSGYIDQRSAENDREVFLIHIDDAYGRQAKRTLVESNVELKRVLSIDPKNTDMTNYSNQIRSFIQPKADPEKHSFVIVVGYGAMVKNMLSELVKFEELQLRSHPNQPLLEEFLVVSTFTEQLWRPDEELGDNEVYNQVHALGPDKSADNEDDRGVVYQFSFLTLDKAIRCANKMHVNPGLQAFSKCWETLVPKGLAKDWMPTVELLSNGDSHIPLRVLDKDEW